MIERTHPALSVGAQCRLLSISRSSFYYVPQGETEMNLELTSITRCAYDTQVGLSNTPYGNGDSVRSGRRSFLLSARKSYRRS